MLIIADENIPAVTEAFSSFGEVKTLHGRHMTAADVKDADVLLVRSITRVNASLLSGSRVKFVGSATIGTDHIDLDWLASQGITFANAPGCNAISAAEYVMSALFTVSADNQLDLTGKTIGIVGCGNVGTRVMARMQAVGLSCLVCDPPRADMEGQDGFVAMSELAASADIITVHVPLVRQGKYATRNLIDQLFIESLSPDCIFINTSRGDVVDETALKHKLQQHKTFSAILDVWNNEPDIDTELVKLVDIATPHIAGYSIDGKLRATQMLYEALCELTDKTPIWDAETVLPAPEHPIISTPENASGQQMMSDSLRSVYDVRRDDEALRNSFALPEGSRGREFDRLRKEYPVRRECSAYQVDESSGNTEYTNALAVFGYTTHR